MLVKGGKGEGIGCKGSKRGGGRWAWGRKGKAAWGEKREGWGRGGWAWGRKEKVGEKEEEFSIYGRV